MLKAFFCGIGPSLKTIDNVSEDSRAKNRNQRLEVIAEVDEAEDLEIYPTHHKQRGKALVFHNTTFLKRKKPPLVDERRLLDTLYLLGFTVDVHRDRTVQQMQTILAKVSAEDHSNCDCLVVVVVTCGQRNKLHASDHSYRIDLLGREFTPTKCPTLKGKPKLFLIQSYKDKSVNQLIREADTKNKTKGKSCSILIADSLVVQSRSEGYSKFMNIICDELRQSGHQEELLSILTRVLRRTESEHASSMQVSMSSTLTRKIYFVRKGHFETQV